MVDNYINNLFLLCRLTTLYANPVLRSVTLRCLFRRMALAYVAAGRKESSCFPMQGRSLASHPTKRRRFAEQKTTELRYAERVSFFLCIQYANYQIFNCSNFFCFAGSYKKGKCCQCFVADNWSSICIV